MYAGAAGSPTSSSGATSPRLRRPSSSTPIRHCNINGHGRICHSILDRNWTADTGLLRVFECVYGLLLSPDTADPLDSTLALSFYEGDGRYEAEIIAHTKLHAMQWTRKQRVALLEASSEDWPTRVARPTRKRRRATVC